MGAVVLHVGWSYVCPCPSLQPLPGSGFKADLLAACSALRGPLIRRKPGRPLVHAGRAGEELRRGGALHSPCPSLGSAHPLEEKAPPSALSPPGALFPVPPSSPRLLGPSPGEG